MQTQNNLILAHCLHSPQPQNSPTRSHYTKLAQTRSTHCTHFKTWTRIKSAKKNKSKNRCSFKSKQLSPGGHGEAENMYEGKAIGKRSLLQEDKEYGKSKRKWHSKS